MKQGLLTLAGVSLAMAVAVPAHALDTDSIPAFTRATYNLEVEIGGMLGMLVRGPIVDVLRKELAGARAGELKQAVEGG